MGGLCSKSSNTADPFAQPGRVLGSSADSNPNPRAPLPQRGPTSGPGRTLGGAGASGGGSNTEPRNAAALAAEVRPPCYLSFFAEVCKTKEIIFT